MGQEAMSLREVLSDERRLSGSYPAMHCASAQRPPGGVGEFIDAEVPNLHRSASVWGRGQGYFFRWGETETGASLLISKAQTSAEKSLIQSRVKYRLRPCRPLHQTPVVGLARAGRWHVSGCCRPAGGEKI